MRARFHIRLGRGHDKRLGLVEARTLISRLRSLFRGVDKIRFHGPCSCVSVVLATAVKEQQDQKNNRYTRYSSNNAALEFDE
jgi:hypothetical protein